MCIPVSPGLRAGHHTKGALVLVSTGDEAGATQALPRDLPSQCQPRLSGQQLLDHELFLEGFLGTLF